MTSRWLCDIIAMCSKTLRQRLDTLLPASTKHGYIAQQADFVAAVDASGESSDESADDEVSHQ